MTRSVGFLSRRTAVLACAAVLCAIAPLPRATADTNPFANLRGDWSGTGIIRVKSEDSKQTNERVRCNAAYRQRGSYDVNLKLTCASDTYNLDLTGEFSSDDGGHVTGEWTEHNRNVGGSVFGRVRGDRLLVHAESPALNANLSMVTHSRNQSVILKAAGGGQQVSASITLRRR